MRTLRNDASPVLPMQHGQSARTLVSVATLATARESWLGSNVETKDAATRHFDGKPAYFIASHPGGSSAKVPATGL